MMRNAGNRLSVVLRRAAAAAINQGRVTNPCQAAAFLPQQTPLQQFHTNNLAEWRKLSPLRSFATAAAEATPTAAVNKDLEVEIEHATGLEREELVGELEGKPRFDNLSPPQGPFGTKEAPALVESQYDERLVGCSGDIGEEEHDVVWFKLKKGSNHECSVCGQVFQLKVVGPGGSPGGHH